MPTYRATFNATYDGEAIANTMHVATGFPTAPGTPAEATTLVTLLAARWTARIQPLLANSWAGVSCDVADIYPDTGVGATTSLSGLGGLSGEAMPGNVTVKVRLVTGLRGRGRRGRMSLPAATENLTSVNQVFSTHRTAINTAFTNLFADLLAATPSTYPVVVSRVFQDNLRPVPLITPVTGTTVGTYVGSANTRKRRG